MGPRRDNSALEIERRRLRELDLERATVLSRIVELKAEHTPDRDAVDVSTADGRVALFMSLFQGRPDLFATRWESHRQPGRSGWAPRCANEWVEGICEKPRVKCGECPNRKFLPFNHAEVRAHLEGRQTMGIYPLLADETCRFVAIDLDGDGWRQDVSAVRDVAEEAEIPALVERSRSGSGAHLWVVFTEPVPARTARALGEWLLTEAMRSRSLPIATYDRLFPNQDTMPSGGFGNLIALPLQRARREQGFTEFLDHALEPYPDQWAYLAGVERLEAERCLELVEEARRLGLTLAVGRWDEDSEAVIRNPRLPDTAGANLPGTQLASASIPAESGPVEVIQAGRIEVNTTMVPASVQARLRRLASFANPMFYEKQRARLSIHNTPRVIACHEERGDRLLLPRGSLTGVVEVLDDADAEVGLHDARTDGRPIDLAFIGGLRPNQELAVREVLKHDIGVLVAPPGAGKTVIGTALIARRAVSTLVLVHRRPLQAQWRGRIVEHLGLKQTDVGTLAAGAAPASSGIDVATVQTLTRRDDLPDLLGSYGQVVVDECHHVGALSIETLLRQAPGRYVLGLTATPHRRDGHHPIVEMQCGPVRHTMEETPAEEDRIVRRLAIERRTGFDPATLPNDPGVQEVISRIAEDEARSDLIADGVLKELAAGRFPLVLTERRAHLDVLAERLANEGATTVSLHGGMGVKARRAADKVLTSGQPRVVVATGRYIGEGFDDPLLDTLVLALPVAWRGTVVQYAGRLHRGREGKSEVRILDYVDHDVGVLRRMFTKRRKAYQAMGYEVR